MNYSNHGHPRAISRAHSDLIRLSLRNSKHPVSETSSKYTKHVLVGRRLGRNPPSVLGDIHLIGIPAPPAEINGTYYPFHGVSGHFTLTTSLLNASASSSTTGRGFFLRPDSASQPASHDATLPPRGWSFLRPITYRARSRSPTRRPYKCWFDAINKDYGDACIRISD